MHINYITVYVCGLCSLFQMLFSNLDCQGTQVSCSRLINSGERIAGYDWQLDGVVFCLTGWQQKSCD